ncbi:RNA-guided endonuclease IscB [Acrocarpospora sp. B8E8]|uniref:RNA-guided endonuclease IscB n=1 Tax=Acrocarpospora sp. B8E8 TaxID=3153572 RepID=UPI00325CA058
MFVLDKHGQPLDPCHPARARRLLASGRAVIHRHTPFVLRLRDRAAADSTLQGVEVGIDPGSKHTGLAVFTERGGSRTGMYSLQLDHRGGQIRDKLTSRAALRRVRRSRDLRYRAPRFSNRTKPKGWLAPSLRHRVDGTMSWVSRLTRWAPVTAVHESGSPSTPTPSRRASHWKEWSISRAPWPDTRSGSICWPSGGVRARTAVGRVCR